MAMVPQGQEEEGLRELTLEELAGHHLILSKRHRKYVLSIFEKHGLSCDVYYECEDARACLKNHFRNLQAPLCGIFYPHSVAVARYAALIRIKSPTNWDSQLTKSLFQTRSRTAMSLAASGLGTAILPASMRGQSEKICPIPIAEKELITGVLLVWRNEEHSDVVESLIREF